jgi:hypothetical protein
MKALKFYTFLTLFSLLMGCGEPTGGVNTNSILAIDSYTHLELYRSANSIDINLQTGNATGVYSGSPFNCFVDSSTRDYLYEVLRSITVKANDSACSPASPLNYERFYSGTAATTIEGCTYYYMGNGPQLMNELYSRYVNQCAP